MATTLTLIKDGSQVSFSKEPAAVFSTLKNGRYTVTISKEKEPRSIEQNALMWLWFACIENATGTPAQDVHDHYCKKFLRKSISWNNSSEVIVSGTRFLKKDAMTDFLNKVQADAQAEFGIILPSREDQYFEDFYEMYK